MRLYIGTTNVRIYSITIESAAERGFSRHRAIGTSAKGNRVENIVERTYEAINNKIAPFDGSLTEGEIKFIRNDIRRML